MQSGIFKHINCRNQIYLNSSVKRFNVPNDLIDWSIDFPTYNPVFYESDDIKGKPWADPDIDNPTFNPKWNEIDGNINRCSHASIKYNIINKYPINPHGRTGLIGRGLLGRWGPNHAADPIVTRWKRDPITDLHIIDNSTKKKILQMVGIERKDTHVWAIPGGMVDPGEKVSVTLKREFMEEALNGLNVAETTLTDDVIKNLEEFFENNIQEVYSGYVDDPRNTDNAWMETVAYNFHDDSGIYVGKFKLTAGDDARNVKWLDLNKNIHLYANHKSIIEEVVKRLSAHW